MRVPSWTGGTEWLTSGSSVAAWCRLHLTECYCWRKLNQKKAEWCQNVFVKASYWRTWVTKLSVDGETAQACGSRPIREKCAFRGLKKTEHSDRGWIVVLQQWREWENQYVFQTLKQSDIFLLQPNKLPNINLLINIILDFNVYVIVTKCRKMSDLLNKWFNQNVNCIEVELRCSFCGARAAQRTKLQRNILSISRCCTLYMNHHKDLLKFVYSPSRWRYFLR